MPPKRLKKGTKEMRAYMASLRARKGSGVMDYVKSGAKSVAKMGIDYGANKLKEMVGNGMKKRKGRGFVGDIAKYGTNKLIDMTGLGVTRVLAPGRTLQGSALVNAGY